jgi:hypothetical protein
LVFWDMPNRVSTTQSPAASWASSGSPDASWPDVLRRLYESLELPGSASDYHFAILRTTEDLWNRRRQDPDVLPEVECLCLLDIKLVETLPGVGLSSAEDEPIILYIPAFGYLVRLYEREGFIEDALQIARRGTALGQKSDEEQRLETLLRELEAEDVA